MRKFLGAAGAFAAGLIVFACSASSSHPPVEGCQGACGGGGGGGGSGGGGSGGPSDSGLAGDVSFNCGEPSNASQCSLCLATNCCTQLTGCDTDVNCSGLVTCINLCGGGATCISMCQMHYGAGVAAYDALSSCSQRCAVCSESGTGDPCGSLSSYQCASTVSCNGLWCTRTCTQDSDCTGLGQNGGNYLGNSNACVRTTTGGLTCSPGCNSVQDCSAFTGTTCRIATDASGSTVFVCGSITDAAAE